jgi:hypothetical protein
VDLFAAGNRIRAALLHSQSQRLSGRNCALKKIYFFTGAIFLIAAPSRRENLTLMPLA